EVGHEVGQRGGAVRVAREFELRPLLLHAGEPEILGELVKQGVHEIDGPRLLARHQVDRVDPALQGFLVTAGALAFGDDDLELLRLLLVLRDLGVQPLDLGGEAPPPSAEHQDEEEGKTSEEHAHIEAWEGEAEAASLRRGRWREVDPDHACLSPARRSPSPTPTASSGPACSSSSAGN